MKVARLLLAAAMLLMSSFAFAGAFEIAPVTINDFGATGEAYGNLLGARFSDNDNEWIGCAVAYGDDGPYAYCEASLVADDDGNVYCVTEDSSMIDMIASINIFSYVYFRWDSAGDCTHVTVATRSLYIPQKLKP